MDVETCDSCGAQCWDAEPVFFAPDLGDGECDSLCWGCCKSLAQAIPNPNTHAGVAWVYESALREARYSGAYYPEAENTHWGRVYLDPVAYNPDTGHLTLDQLLAALATERAAH